jgi:hypothetical protein
MLPIHLFSAVLLDNTSMIVFGGYDNETGLLTIFHTLSFMLCK